MLGVVPGHIGLVQATEVLKLILGAGTPMIGKFYIYNALTLTMQVIEAGRNAGCPLCGENPRITSLTGAASAKYDSGGGVPAGSRVGSTMKERRGGMTFS